MNVDATGGGQARTIRIKRINSVSRSRESWPPIVCALLEGTSRPPDTQQRRLDVDSRAREIAAFLETARYNEFK